jgi:hypothetical protein
MPARRLRPKCRHIFTLLAVLFVVPASVEAQSSVTLRGTVSETVTLSVAPTFTQSNVDVVISSGNTVRVTLSGDDAVIRVPLLVRSNSRFKISAVFESTTTELSQLSVSEVQATGALVSPQVLNSLEVREEGSRPLLVVSGPRVSLGGTLESPNNALQITVLIRLSPQTPHGSLAQLTFVGSPIQ